MSCLSTNEESLSPGETLDIAAWSTVEQGLAITAGSLATLRPLLKLVMFKLGHGSKPSHMGPPAYPPASGAASRGKSSRLDSSQAASGSLNLSPVMPKNNSAGPWVENKVTVDVTDADGSHKSQVKDAYGWEIIGKKGASEVPVRGEKTASPLARQPCLLQRVYRSQSKSRSTFYENESEEELARAADLEAGAPGSVSGTRESKTG